VKRVLCAVDLSNISAQVLRHAQAIVQGDGGCLTVRHVVPAFGAIEARPGEWFDPLTVGTRINR
jgi:universal stress protein family protein